MSSAFYELKTFGTFMHFQLNYYILYLSISDMPSYNNSLTPNVANDRFGNCHYFNIRIINLRNYTLILI